MIATHTEEFTSNDVSAALHVSLRQLQWWDERSVVRPTHRGHRRFYSESDTIAVAAVSALRDREMSLHKIRRCLRKLKADLEPIATDVFAGDTVFLVIPLDAKFLTVTQDREHAFDAVLGSRKPVIVIELGPLVRRVLVVPERPKKERW